MPFPRYCSPNASAPMLSFRDPVTDREARNSPAGFVRWKVCHVETGRTIQASEWMPDNRFARETLAVTMQQVEREQHAAAMVRRLGMGYEESL